MLRSLTNLLIALIFCTPLITSAQGGHILKRNGEELSFTKLYLIIYGCVGENWMEIKIPSDHNLRKIVFLSPGTDYSAGSKNFDEHRIGQLKIVRKDGEVLELDHAGLTGLTETQDRILFFYRINPVTGKEDNAFVSSYSVQEIVFDL